MLTSHCGYNCCSAARTCSACHIARRLMRDAMTNFCGDDPIDLPGKKHARTNQKFSMRMVALPRDRGIRGRSAGDRGDTQPRGRRTKCGATNQAPAAVCHPARLPVLRTRAARSACATSPSIRPTRRARCFASCRSAPRSTVSTASRNRALRRLARSRSAAF